MRPIENLDEASSKRLTEIHQFIQQEMLKNGGYFSGFQKILLMDNEVFGWAEDARPITQILSE